MTKLILSHSVAERDRLKKQINLTVVLKTARLSAWIKGRGLEREPRDQRTGAGRLRQRRK